MADQHAPEGAPMGKPSFKFFAIMNVIINLPLAAVMSTLAPILAGNPLAMPNWIYNVLLGFVIACIINMILPVQKMAMGVPAALHMDPQSLAGRLVGNIIPSFIFTLIIGLALTAFNVIPFLPEGAPVPIVVFAETMKTFLPLWLGCFIVSFLLTPLGIGAAMKYGH